MINGKKIHLKLSHKREKDNDKSQFHLRARSLLKRLYPFDKPYEEVTIPEINIRFDFFFSSLRLAIEVDGQQHSQYSPFFHKSKLGFIQSQQRDMVKEEFCRINDVYLVRLSFDEDDETWKTKILNRS